MAVQSNKRFMSVASVPLKELTLVAVSSLKAMQSHVDTDNVHSLLFNLLYTYWSCITRERCPSSMGFDTILRQRSS